MFLETLALLPGCMAIALLTSAFEQSGDQHFCKEPELKKNIIIQYLHIMACALDRLL